MASDNTATITFDADLSGLNDALDEAASGVGGFGSQADAAFAGLAAAMQKATALAPGLSQGLAGVKPPRIDSAAIDQMSQSAQAAAARLQETIIESDAKTADDKIRTARQTVGEEQELGQISATAALQQLQGLADQEHAVNLTRIADMRSVYAAQGDAAGLARNGADQSAEVQRYIRQTSELQTQAALKAKQQWNDVATSVSRAFTTSVQGIVLGTETIHQAMTRLGQNILTEFIDGTIQKMVQQWIAGNTAIQTATQALQGFLGITDAENAATSTDTAQASASENINVYASEGAAAAIASTAAIPLVGPELAPAAGAGIYADIVSLNAYAGGGLIDADQVAMIHQNERVLPARYSAGLDAMVGNAASGQGQGGSHTFNNTFHINAGDGVTARQLPAMIQGHLERSVRNGSFKTMSRT
jgi:hypothetical protein